MEDAQNKLKKGVAIRKLMEGVFHFCLGLRPFLGVPLYIRSSTSRFLELRFLLRPFGPFCLSLRGPFGSFGQRKGGKNSITYWGADTIIAL